MKRTRTLSIVLMSVLFISSSALAVDFAWLDELNIRAQADPSGFKAELAARFRIGSAEIKTVISNVERPADAYMVLRLGEMAKLPADRVITQYRKSKGQGWGVLAKSLGIKPGSREFHALKRGHDLHWPNDSGAGKSKGKGKKRK